VGQHQTLPGGQHDPPRTRDQARRRDRDGRDVDQPPVPPAPTPPVSERPSYRGIPLDGTPEELHRAVDLLEADTVPYTYYAKVIANQRQHDQLEPLGRRTPEPLDTRQGVER
jgi:hypothetical protein